MSSRIKSTLNPTQVKKPLNQENIPTILEKKNTLHGAAKVMKRPVLGEATNTLAQQQALAKRTSKIASLAKPAIVGRNPIRTLKCSTLSTIQPIAAKKITSTSSLPVPNLSRAKPLAGANSCLKAVEDLPIANLEINCKENKTSRKLEEKAKEVHSKLGIKKEKEPISASWIYVEDIDANDHDNPFLVSPYVNEIYEYLRYLENKFPVHESYLKEAIISPIMRGTLVSWLIEVQIQYKLSPETLHQTVFIVDRYLQVATDLPKSKLQLVGVTAMFIAAKYEETYCPDVEAFVYISDNAFTKLDVLTMEKLIIKSLNFGISRPCSIHFLRRYSKAAGATPVIHTFGKYFLELALIDYNLCHILPSRLSAAAIYIAISVSKHTPLTNKSTWTPSLIYYSNYKFKNIKPVVDLLAATIQNAPVSKRMSVVKRKYAEEKLFKVSLSSLIQPPVIKKLMAENCLV